jgi:hypothetical protein
MTIKEYQKKLDRRIKEFSFTNKDIYLCVATTHADYKRRIFVEGKRPSGAIIGTYSPSYQKRRMKTKTFKTVNFVDQGRLETNIANSLQRRSNMVVVNGATTDFEANKVNWLIDKYGEDVWQLSKKELKELSKCLAAQSIKIITK